MPTNDNSTLASPHLPRRVLPSPCSCTFTSNGRHSPNKPSFSSNARVSGAASGGCWWASPVWFVRTHPSIRVAPRPGHTPTASKRTPER